MLARWARSCRAHPPCGNESPTVAPADHPRHHRPVRRVRQGPTEGIAACRAGRRPVSPGQEGQRDRRCGASPGHPDTAGRRGRKSDVEWINRRRLLRAAETLTFEQRTELFTKLLTADPSEEIAAAWIAKELLRDLLACTARGGLRYEIRAALYRFYKFCAACPIPGGHRARAHRGDLAGSHHPGDRDRPDQRTQRRLQPDRQARRPDRVRIPQSG